MHKLRNEEGITKTHGHALITLDIHFDFPPSNTENCFG